MTIAKRPFVLGGDGKGYTPDLRFGNSEYFCKRDWTAQITLIRFSKFDFTCKSENAGSHATTGVSTLCASHDEIVAGIKPTRP